MRVCIIAAALALSVPAQAQLRAEFERARGAPLWLEIRQAAPPAAPKPAPSPVAAAKPPITQPPVAAFNSPLKADPLFEAGLLSALPAAGAGLAAKADGGGESAFVLVRLFELRRDAGNLTGWALQQLAGRVTDRYSRMVIEEAAKDLLSAPQHGEGNSSYWTQMIARQDSAYERVADRLRRLAPALPKSQGAPFNGGVLAGLLAVERPLRDDIAGEGPSAYWRKTFEARRAYGEAVSRELARLAGAVSDRRLGSELAQLSSDLLSVSERQGSTAHEWMRNAQEQAQIFARVADRIVTLREIFK